MCTAVDMSEGTKRRVHAHRTVREAEDAYLAAYVFRSDDPFRQLRLVLRRRRSAVVAPDVRRERTCKIEASSGAIRSKALAPTSTTVCI
jgi:hypothetical protein